MKEALKIEISDEILYLLETEYNHKKEEQNPKNYEVNEEKKSESLYCKYKKDTKEYTELSPIKKSRQTNSFVLSKHNKNMHQQEVRQKYIKQADGDIISPLNSLISRLESESDLLDLESTQNPRISITQKYLGNDFNIKVYGKLGKKADIENI